MTKTGTEALSAAQSGDRPALGRLRSLWPQLAAAFTPANGVIAVTVLLFLVPALADLLRDERRAYGYLAPDAFYYFTVGVNWSRFGIPSYDQVHATNGFHPLWQWVIVALFEACSRLGLSRLALVPVSVVVGLICIAAALVLLGKVMTRGRRLTPWFMLLPVGAFATLISWWWWPPRALAVWSFHARTLPLFGTLWSFANGLESAVLILTFALVAWLYVRWPLDRPRRALVFGGALGLMSLARLDHAVFALVILVALLLAALARKSPSQLRLAVMAALTWSACLGAYLVYNRFTVGRFTPVSGAIKSSFPHITTSNWEALTSFQAAPIDGKRYQLGRLGSLLIPALGALLYLPFALTLEGAGERRIQLRDGNSDRVSQLLLMTAIGTILLAAYDALFVTNYQIGQWYAPVPVVFLSLFAMQAADRIAIWWSPGYGPVASMVVALGLLGASVVYFCKLHWVPSWGALYADFCLIQAPRAVAHYGPSPPKLISYDDGVVAFGTGFPTTSGTLLALDPPAASAYREGRFKELMTERGIERVTVLSYYYGSVAAAALGKGSDELRTYAGMVLHDPLETRNIKVEYSDGSFAVLATRPRNR